MSDTISSWLNNAGRYPQLSQIETLELARRIQAAEPGSAVHTKLVNKLCRHNLRLVVNFTRSYMHAGSRKLTWGSDQTLDLLQEGYFGLRRAACKFDPERGYTFSTYANAWVRQALGKYHVDKLSMIRVPESSAREIFYYDNHGVPRNEKVAPWVAEASRCAQKAYALGSTNSLIGEDSTFEDVLSDENRLIEPTEQLSYDGCYQVMHEAGIPIEHQDVIVSYVKRGNLDSAMMKNQVITTKANRAAIRASIQQIKEYVGQ